MAKVALDGTINMQGTKKSIGPISHSCANLQIWEGNTKVDCGRTVSTLLNKAARLPGMANANADGIVSSIEAHATMLDAAIPELAGTQAAAEGRPSSPNSPGCSGAQ